MIAAEKSEKESLEQAYRVSVSEDDDEAESDDGSDNEEYRNVSIDDCLPKEKYFRCK